MFDIFVDPSVAEQIYVEDCYVCCQPILLAVRVGMSGEISIEARQENDWLIQLKSGIPYWASQLLYSLQVGVDGDD